MDKPLPETKEVAWPYTTVLITPEAKRAAKIEAAKAQVTIEALVSAAVLHYVEYLREQEKQE